MAYEVTATRRRPQSFSDLVGQEFVVATLENAIKSGKIAHAYLFSGPRGCGKTTSARILAKMLNCEKGVEHAPCGECLACKEIAKGSCMDVIEIDGASNTSVNDVRQIKDEVLFPPNSFKYKIYIIDEVHMLSTSAFNALLKTIEEPPPYVIFIFATTELHKVPATIKSRCQQFNFRLGSVEQIKELLAQTVTELGIKADDEALFWIARESTGSFRDAYTLFDQVSAFSEGYITYDKIRDKLGITGVEQLNTLCEICITGNTSQALEQIHDILESGVSIEQFISNLTDYLRNMLLIKSGITKESLLGQSAERFSVAVLNAWSSAQLEHALSLFLQLYRDIRYSLNPRYELEVSISRLCWLSDWVSAKALKNAISQAQHLLTSSSNNDSTTAGSGALKTNQVGGMAKFNILERQQSSQPQQPIQQQTTQPVQIKQSQPVQQQLVQPIRSQTAPQSVQHQSIPVQQANPVQSQAEPSTVVSEKFAQVGVSPNCSVEELKNIAIKEYGRARPLVAAALMQTCNWQFADNQITALIDHAYTKKQLDEWRKELDDLFSHIWQKNVTFKVELQKQEKKKMQIPQSVELVCDVFKGSVTSLNKNEKLHDENES